jgi:hypothetical protein
MPLAAGTRLGPYEIVGSRKSGMGEVYRSRDTKLERDVASKFFPRSSPATLTGSLGSSVKRNYSRR